MPTATPASCSTICRSLRAPPRRRTRTSARTPSTTPWWPRRCRRTCGASTRAATPFYDQISALHKAVRGSPPDASLYWFARMLDGGVDPGYLARRLIRMASEDIGLADPRALRVTLDAADVYERLGTPEGELALARAVVYLACAAKSKALHQEGWLALGTTAPPQRADRLDEGSRLRLRLRLRQRQRQRVPLRARRTRGVRSRRKLSARRHGEAPAGTCRHPGDSKGRSARSSRICGRSTRPRAMRWTDRQAPTGAPRTAFGRPARAHRGRPSRREPTSPIGPTSPRVASSSP